MTRKREKSPRWTIFLHDPKLETDKRGKEYRSEILCRQETSRLNEGLRDSEPVTLGQPFRFYYCCLLARDGACWRDTSAKAIFGV